MKNTKKPSETLKFKEPKLKGTNTYSSRRLLRRIKDWFADYYRVAVPSFICLALVVAGVIYLLTQKKVVATPAVEENVQADTLNASSQIEIKEEPLMTNAYEAVDQFVAAYYAAMADGNAESYKLMRDHTSETETVTMLAQSKYIEKYENIICYTKTGPIANSYIVYAYYEVKFMNLDTLAPALKRLFLCTAEDGSLYVVDTVTDEQMLAYIEEVSQQVDVQDLFTEVQVKYLEAVDSDANLKTFMDNLAIQLKTDVGEALALVDTEEDDTEAGDTPNPGDTDSNPDLDSVNGSGTEVTDTPEITGEMVKTTSQVNIRATADASGQKVATAKKGEVYMRLESLDNGWSKIKYNDSEAYIKSSFLEVVVDVIGSVTATDNVNIRASASPSATKLGVAYKGDVFELLEEMGNGWSKITYNNQTAYIKSEYLKKNN